jgi:hypothetical protein
MFNSNLLRPLLIVFVCCTFQSNAQSDSNQDLAIATVNAGYEEAPRSAVKAAPGTYQFIVDPQGLDEAFPSDILVIAELLRQDDETTYHKLSSHVTLKIISRQEIAARNFVDDFLILKKNN